MPLNLVCSYASSSLAKSFSFFLSLSPPSLQNRSIPSGRGQALRFRRTRDLPYFWSNGSRYPHTPSSTSSFTSSNNAEVGYANCENACVSCGGEENPASRAVGSKVRWWSWLGRPSGGVAVPALYASLEEVESCWVIGEGNCCFVDTGVPWGCGCDCDNR